MLYSIRKDRGFGSGCQLLGVRVEGVVSAMVRVDGPVLLDGCRGMFCGSVVEGVKAAEAGAAGSLVARQRLFDVDIISVESFFGN